MSFKYSMEDRLTMGISDLKSGAKYSLIAYLLTLLIAVAVLMIFPSLFVGNVNMKAYPMNLDTLIGLGIFVVLVGIVILVVSLAALYKFYKATGHLKEFDPRLNIGRTGILIAIAGLVVLFLGTFIAGLAVGLTVPGPGPGAVVRTVLSIIGVVILGMALVVVGEILFAVMVMRLAEVEGLDQGFKIAGALYITSVVLSFIPYVGIAGYAVGLVSMFLIYTYSKNSLESLEMGTGRGLETGSEEG